MKSGWKTSEFWVSIGSAVLPTVLPMLGLPPMSAWTPLVGAVYAVVRTGLKIAHIFKDPTAAGA